MSDDPQEQLPTELGGLNPGELFARALHTPIPSGTGGRGWIPPTVEELKRALPQYDIIEMLGLGGMGAVYKGMQRSLDRFVAIKILPPGLEDADVHYAERFKIEAKAMAHLSHPGIVAVHDAGETANGLLYFVMEFIEGTDVQKMIAQGPLPPDTALAITAHVCDALGFAHERGVIHRDIKPANIMVDTHGRVKVADFGLAKVTTDESGGFTGTNLTMGTPNYMAPEAMTSIAKVDGRADLYAVGVMLYAMLTGKIPRGRFALASTTVSGLDPRFDAIVDKAMQADRDERYASAAALRADIDRILTQPVPVEQPSAPVVVAPKRGKAPLLIAAITVVGITAIAALVHFAPWKKGANDGETRPIVSQTPAPEPGASKLWDSASQLPQENGISWENGAVRLDGTPLVYSAIVSRDGIMRADVRMNPDGAGQQLNLRYRNAPGAEEFYHLELRSRESVIILEFFSHGKKTELARWPLPRVYGPDEWLRLELRAVGDELTASADGKVLGTVHDSSLTESGKPRLYAGAAGYFRNIVYVPLDKDASVPKSGAAAAAALAANPANWVDCLNTRKWEAPWVFEDGVLKTTDKTRNSPFLAVMQDGAIRVRAARARGLNLGTGAQLQLVLRSGAVPGSEHTTGLYQFQTGIGGTTCGLSYFERKNGTETKDKLWSFMPLPAALAGQTEIELELRAVGDEFSVWGNGQLVASAHDSRVPLGGASFISDTSLEITRAETINFASASAPAATTAVPRTSSAVSWPDGVDLLARADLKRDAVRGTWVREGGTLIGDSDKYPTIQLTDTLPDEYDFRVEFTPLNGTGICPILSKAGHQFTANFFAGTNRNVAGIEMIAGDPVWGKKNNTSMAIGAPAPDRRYVALVEVRSGGVKSYLDGKLLASWKTDYADMSLSPLFKLRSPTALGLGCEGRTAFHRIEVRDAGGKPAMTNAPPDSTGWISLLPSLDPTADAVKGEWTRVAGGLQGMKLGKVGEDLSASFQLPYQPPEEYDFRIAFTPTASQTDTSQTLSAGGHSFQWSPSGYNSTKAGFSYVGGMSLKDSAAAVPYEPLRLGTRRESLVEVRRDRVTGYIGGKKVVEWKTDYTDMDIGPVAALRDPACLGLSLYNGKTIFHDISVREVTGKGKFTRGTAAFPPATTYPQPPQWTDATAYLRNQYLGTDGLVADGEWLKASVSNKTFGLTSGQTFRNPIVRVRYSDRADIILRRGNPNEGDSRYKASIFPDRQRLALLDNRAAVQWLTDAQTISPHALPGEEHEAVFAAQGDTLTLWLDGRKAASVQDHALSVGNLAIALTKGDPLGDGRVKKVEYGELPDDAPAAPAMPAKKTSASYPQPAAWIDATNEVGRKMVNGKVAVLEGESLRIIMGGVAAIADGREFHNAVVRMHCTHAAFIFLRQQGKVRYNAAAGSGGQGAIELNDPAQKATTSLRREAGIPTTGFDPDAEHEVVLAVQDDKLTLWLDGVEKATMRDTTLARGAIGMQVNSSEGAAGTVRIRKVEYAELPDAAAPVSPAPSLPISSSVTFAAATKDAPFVNSLGMKFVPVPIIGGPTDGQRVLFSVWTTRVQDFEIFTVQTNREWIKASIATSSTHPAVGVTWDDAQAFCTWLTERERKAGRLRATERYRLPSDHEWSCAAGIGECEDPAKMPDQKNGKIADVFPWGNTWPPPPGAGNYSGEEAAGHELTEDQKILPGYRDDFPGMAPVGSFAANPFGLFDLGGNVREFCEDWTNSGQTRRVMRGGSLAYSARGDLLSSARRPAEQAARSGDLGFRIVLAVDKAP